MGSRVRLSRDSYGPPQSIRCPWVLKPPSSAGETRHCHKVAVGALEGVSLREFRRCFAGISLGSRVSVSLRESVQDAHALGESLSRYRGPYGGT
jgi:hypothetical protein